MRSSMSRLRELSEGEEDPAMVKCRGRRFRSHRGRGNKHSGGSECTGGGSGTTTIGGAVVSISLSTASTENRLCVASEGVTFTRWRTQNPDPSPLLLRVTLTPVPPSSATPRDPSGVRPSLPTHLSPPASAGRRTGWCNPSPSALAACIADIRQTGRFARDSEPRPVP